MMEVNMEVDLCIICCSKVKTEKEIGNNISNCSLLSSNLIVFYLLRKVLQLNENELKKNLIGCGHPVEWIKLCDKCTELTGQAEKLNRKLKKIERELRCVEQLIWDKTVKSINCEADRELVEETIDFTKSTGQVWRRIRNHVANKSNSVNRWMPTETFTNPFIEGDKLSNYLINRNVSTAILQVEEPEVNEGEENNDHVNILEGTNLEETLPASGSSINRIEVKVELDPLAEVLEKEPQLPPDLVDHDNLLIDNLLEELEEVKVESDDPLIQNQDICENKVVVNLEEMEVDSDGGDQMSNDKDDKEEGGDWNWEPDEVEEDGDNEVDDEDDKEDDSGGLEENLVKGVSANKSAPERKKSKSSYIKKGTINRRLRTADGKFKCRHCDQTFARLQTCNGHERSKHPKTPGAFVCDICGDAFDCRDYLRKHSRFKHELNKWDPEKLKMKKERGKIIRTEDGKFECPHCDQIFLSSSGCSGHIHNKHSKTPGAFICDICGRAFNTSDYLRSHKTCSHRVRLDGTPIPKKAPKQERDHICDQCGKGLINTRQLKKHVRFVHEKRFDIKCALCGTGWPSRNALKKHMLAVHAEDPLTKKLKEEEGLGLWTCPVVGCQVRFLREDGVKGHLKSKHGKREEEVEGLQLGADAGVVAVLEDPSIKATCDKCGKICRNKVALKKHEELHENEGKARDIFCEICGKGFVTREQLKGHVDRVHLNKKKVKGKDFKCELCGKGYTDRHKLRDHLELHEKGGRRDVFCDKCGHGFTLERYLRIHKRRTNCGEEGKVSRVYNRKGE